MTPEDALPIGTVLDERYRIDAELGTGGMGTVYRGHHVALGRDVAIKVLRGDLGADSEWARRFQREAFATARLDHPNCVGIVDCGSLPNGRPYIVMQLVRGDTLLDQLDQHGRIEPLRALRIIRHVLTGLHHAHELGMVHRDVKPANIMLSPKQGAPDFAKLLDFGVVKLIGDAFEQAGGQTLTHAGCAVGSPTYMSPEQVTGETIDGRSDLYSATIVLFEMLTDRPPFVADEALELVRMHLRTPPPRVADVALDLDLPPGLEDLIRDGLVKSPSARIPTAQAYIDRIDRIAGALVRAESAPTTPRPVVVRRPVSSAPPPLAPQPRWRPTRRFGVAAMASLAVLLLVIISASLSGDEPAASSVLPGVADVTDVTDEVAALASPAAPAAAVADVPELAEVHDLIREDRRDAAIKRLNELRRDYPDEPYLAVLQGTLYLDKFFCRDGFAAYRAAFAIDPDTRNNPAVIRSAVNALRSRNNHRLAAAFLVAEIGDPAIPYLEEATRADNKTLRERAAEVLQRIRARAGG